MEITPNELRDREIATAFRGFDQNEVHELLDRAADTIEALQARVRQLTDTLSEANRAPAPASEPTEQPTAAAARTLELAQRVADETVEEAQARAAEIVASAEEERDRLVATAEAEVAERRAGELGRVEAEIAELDARRRELATTVDELLTFEHDYRERLLTTVRDDLARIEGRTPTEPPAVVTSSTPAPAPATEQIEVIAPAPADEAPAPAAPAEEEVVDEEPDASSDALAAAAPIEARGIAEEPVEERPTTPLIGSAVEPPAPADPTIDLASEAAAEQEALEALTGASDDDDDFFASLREATSEHAALSPGEASLFETDDERDSSLRDVFRRRR